MVVVLPAGPEGPRRLAAAGASRVLVLGGECPAEPRIEVFAGPLEPARLPLRDHSVDAIVCVEGFVNLDVAARRGLVGEARRTLRAGGMLAVDADPDDTTLWQIEDDLRTAFAHVVALAQLAWQGVSLAPLLPQPPGEALTPSLREGLLAEPLPTQRYVLLASPSALEAPSRECTIVPTGPVVISPPVVEVVEVPVAIPAPPPVPEIADFDLVALFAAESASALSTPPPVVEPPRVEPRGAPAFDLSNEGTPAPAPDPALIAELEELRRRVASPPEPDAALVAELEALRRQVATPPEPDAAMVAELEALRRQVATPPEPDAALVAELEALRRQAASPPEPDAALVAELEALREHVGNFAREREGLVAHALKLAAELDRCREEKARTEAELHVARQRLESLQHVQEDSRMHSLASLVRRAGLPGAEPAVATHELVDEIAPLVTPESGRATADAALDRNRLREELARRTAELQALETRVLQQEEELRREHLENVRLVTDVDRLREQVERSRAIEQDRVQELERLGHELRKIEVDHAELTGLYNTQEQRLRAREEAAGRAGSATDAGVRVELDQVTAERDQLRARERAAGEIVRRRDRELADATRTVRELRRSVEDHATLSAQLRGELAVLQVQIQRLEETVPSLQERLREQQRKTLDREEEAAELQRKLEESVAEQEHLRGRLRRQRQDIEALAGAKQGAEVELFRLRRELEAKHQAIDQLQQIVSLGTGHLGQIATGPLSDGARAELLALRGELADQAAEHAEALARSEAEHQKIVENERVRLRRARLEAAIRAEEMEYMLFQLDTAEQRIWEMNDATDRAAARLAAGLAQLEKQKEQYEDLADELEVTRNLLVEAQAKVAELERLLDNERARLARVSLAPAVILDEAPDTSGSFDVTVDEPDPESEELEAPAIRRYDDDPDRLAGIDVDDDDDADQISLAVRLAGGGPADSGSRFDLSALTSSEVSSPVFRLPSDDDVDLEEDVEPRPPRVVVVPDEDDEDEVFTIDTEWGELDVAEAPATPPPAPRSGFDREQSNARIVIEVLEDEAWPEDEGQSEGQSEGQGQSAAESGTRRSREGKT